MASLTVDANKRAEADRNWQREVMQNQLQWKAADARKAGLHPLAAIGGGAYSASNVSAPSSSFAQSLGKLGDSIGDAFNAYKTKEEAAKEAAWIDEQRQMQRDEHDMTMRIGASQVLMNNGNALEATKRAASYTTPWATGREVMPGQVDSPSSPSKNMGAIKKFNWPINPDGSYGDPVPSSEYKEAYEDVPFLEFIPPLDAFATKWRSILSRSRIDGLRFNWRNNTWSR